MPTCVDLEIIPPHLVNKFVSPIHYMYKLFTGNIDLDARLLIKPAFASANLNARIANCEFVSAQN